ncbi:nitrous oxide-stimulated promoter family protein [Heliobacillus mobilis]|uniref:Nitrous oxide-stimulated promoter family protein n=1 Tax=Heliobacterium mobile TaxID=28064 RepID=A0A6I3SM56_HELMO|nr:nitrous oxide-stimulated promoter family protein [Heliobacterium mobile]MTV49969.1 nitrous oxide-stimulated promoter family protein [Heliobacterium mobile]
MQNNGRSTREKKTVHAMIQIYCDAHHGHDGGLCPDCQELINYAFARLERCKFGEQKSTCGRCPVHCYKKDMREKITAVMRFSGPKMLTKHPILAFWHLVDGIGKP